MQPMDEPTPPTPSDVCVKNHPGCARTHKPGRPRKDRDAALEPGPPAPEPAPEVGALTRFTGDDGRSLDPGQWEAILRCYLDHRANLTRTARALDIPLGVLRRWKRENRDFSEALDSVREIINDQIIGQLTERALDPNERNPAWKIFFMKKNIPQYADRPKENQKIELTIADSTFRRP